MFEHNGKFIRLKRTPKEPTVYYYAGINGVMVHIQATAKFTTEEKKALTALVKAAQKFMKKRDAMMKARKEVSNG
jgi:hypothetical protein